MTKTSAVGFIGLGNMGLAMVKRLIGADHRLVVYDTRSEVVDGVVALGAAAAFSPREVADRAEVVLASLPTPQASLAVAAGDDGVIGGSRIRAFVDLSTVGSEVAQRNQGQLSTRDIAAFDAPVSGGVSGAEQGTLAVMVSGPPDAFETVRPLLETIGRPVFVSEKAGAAQTMKLVNNMLAATTLAATAEVMVMGVKSGLDPQVMLEVLNAGSGATHASRDKFPKAVLPRTFDYGFATGLMVKDLRLYLDEARVAESPAQLAEAVARTWEATLSDQGADSDFTCVVKPMEKIAGVIVEGRPG